MKGTILITDSLFILPEHEAKIRAAGYEIERLDKPEATTAELCAAIKGKVGYILGGVERVTKEVIDAADALKVVSFTGIACKDFIPAWEHALARGIVLTNAPDGPTQPVAEWAVGMALAMNRGFFAAGRVGDKKFLTTRGIEGQQIGIIGLGRIGSTIARLLQPFHPTRVTYWSQHQRPELERELGLDYQPLVDILRESDIVFLCVSKDAGESFLSTKEFALMKQDALLVSFVHDKIVDEAALLHALQERRIRAASDDPIMGADFAQLPFDRWYCMNASNAFNTEAGIKRTSDLATTSLLNVLTTGTDQHALIQ